MAILLSQVNTSNVIDISFTDLYCILTGGTNCTELEPGKYYIVNNFRTSYFLANEPGTFWDNPAIKSDYNSTVNADPLLQELPTDIIALFDNSTNRGHQILFGVDAQTITPSTTPVVTDMFFGDKEPLIVLAIAPNKISPQAWSTTFQNDIIYWDPLATYDVVVSQPQEYYMGRITYRKDTIRNIEAFYDFRSVKFMRYTRTSEVKRQMWYALGDYGVAAELFTVGQQSNPKPIYGGTTALSPFYLNAHYTFGNNTISFTAGAETRIFSDPIGFKNITINEFPTKELWQRKELNNIVLFTPQNLGAGQNEDANDTVCQNIIFESGCIQMSIDGTGFKNNTFGRNSIMNIIMSNNFRDNIIGSNFSQNLFEGDDPAPGTLGGPWAFLRNQIGANFTNNWFHGGGSTPPINEFIENKVDDSFTYNDIHNQVYRSIFSRDFFSNYIRNYFIENRIMRPVSEIHFKLQLIDSASFVSGFDVDYIGVLSLEKQILEQDFSTFSAGVLYDGINTVHSTHATPNNPSGNPPYTLNLSGFDIVGNFYVKAYDSNNPLTFSPIISSPHRVEFIINGPVQKIRIIPIKSAGSNSILATPTDQPKHYVIRLISQSTSQTISANMIALATEFLDLDSEFNDWVEIGRRRYLLPQNWATDDSWYQLTGENYYGISTMAPDPE